MNQVDGKTKLIMFPSPNSVAGNEVAQEKIVELLEKFDGMVFVDEAYFEFLGETSIALIEKYDNLVVSRTLSKAWGLAGVRIGYCVCSEENILSLRKIKLPYNKSCVDQAIAQCVVQNNEGKMREQVKAIGEQREFLSKNLREFGLEVFPSCTNFVLARFPPRFSSKKIQEKLAGEKIIVRDRSSLPLAENCIRITVGTQEENAFLLKELQKILGEEK